MEIDKAEKILELSKKGLNTTELKSLGIPNRLFYKLFEDNKVIAEKDIVAMYGLKRIPVGHNPRTRVVYKRQEQLDAWVLSNYTPTELKDVPISRLPLRI
jgi:hypothetical protein